MKNYKPLLFSLIQCFILLPIKAVELPWYEIEILIFEQSNKPRLESENWQQPEQLTKTDKSHNFITPQPSSVVLKELCVNGQIVPIIEQLTVTDVIDEMNNEAIKETLDSEHKSESVAGTSTAYSANAEVTDKTMGENLEPFVEEKAFVILDKSFNQLNEAMTNLKRRRGYHPLIHMTWRQPVSKKKNSNTIRLFAGINYSDTFNPKGDAKVNIASADPELYGVEAQFENSPLHVYSDYSEDNDNHDYSDDSMSDNNFSFHQQLELVSIDPRIEIKKQLNACQQQYQIEKDNRVTDVWQLDGNVRIYAERYLHIETDLFLSIPGKKEVQLSALETSLAADRILNSLQLNNNDNSMLDNGFGWQLGEDFLLEDQNDGIVMQDVLNRYVMQQSRRLRRNETHYIDHPLFGLLIQIRPYDGNLPPNDD